MGDIEEIASEACVPTLRLLRCHVAALGSRQQDPLREMSPARSEDVIQEDEVNTCLKVGVNGLLSTVGALALVLLIAWIVL